MDNQSRFNRNYRLIVQSGEDAAVVIEPPFRVVFNADKSTDKSVNKATIKVYNLSQMTRASMVKDEHEKKKISVELLIGYGNTVERIFKGTVNIGMIGREGNDIITTMECQDGGFDFRFSYTSQCNNDDPINVILKDMPNTSRGKITNTRPRSSRPVVLVGNSYKLIERNLKGQKFFIDDESLNIMNPDEVLSDVIPVVEAATGLMNTPTREEKKVIVESLLNPALRLGQLFELRSTTAPHLNGIYKIEIITYAGDNWGESWFQTVKASMIKDYKVL